MRLIKVLLAVLLVLAVSFFVARSYVSKKQAIPQKPISAAVQPSRKIKWSPAVPKQTPALEPLRETKIPRIAIVLDDWGNNLTLVQNAVEIHRPLTLSILPHLVRSKEIAEEAYKNNLGVMLHMPMQPKSSKEILEPKTILLTNSDKEIIQYLDEALASVPHVEGVNNHMGSAATCDERVMRVFLGHLKNTGLFFIDSNTDRGTVAFKVASQLAVPCAKREVFLDNQLDAGAVRKQLLRAKKVALTRGQVIVIGHDKKVTLQAIKEMVPEIEKDGVRLVLVKDLLK